MIGRVYRLRGRYWRVVARWGKPEGLATHNCSRCGWYCTAIPELPLGLPHRCSDGEVRKADRRIRGGPRNVLIEEVRPTHGPTGSLWVRVLDPGPGPDWPTMKYAPRVVRPFRGLRRV